MPCMHRHLTASTDPVLPHVRRAVLCLALGAVHRSKGGLSLQGVVAPSVEALLGAASRPAGSSHLWALHGLWLVANAAGPSFMPHVRASLQLAQQLLVSRLRCNLD